MSELILIMSDRKLGNRARLERGLELPTPAQCVELVWQVISDPDLFHVAVAEPRDEVHGWPRFTMHGFDKKEAEVVAFCARIPDTRENVISSIMWVKRAGDLNGD